MAERTTKAQRQLRVKEFLRILLAGGGRQQCLEFAHKEWGLCVRSADDLLKQARQEIERDWTLERSEVLAQLLSQLGEIHQLAIRRNQLQVAVNAVREMAKLCRLYD